MDILREEQVFVSPTVPKVKKCQLKAMVMEQKYNLLFAKLGEFYFQFKFHKGIFLCSFFSLSQT